jgi:hypothetical protein
METNPFKQVHEASPVDARAIALAVVGACYSAEVWAAVRFAHSFSYFGANPSPWLNGSRFEAYVDECGHVDVEGLRPLAWAYLDSLNTTP